MASEDSTGREIERQLFNREIDWDTESTIGAVFFGPEKSREFPPLPRGPVYTALEQGYIDPGARQGNAPLAGQLLEWVDEIGTRYKEDQLDIGFIGYLTAPRVSHELRLEGIVIRSVGQIPDDVEREAVKRFNPDYYTVDDGYLELRWE